MLLSKFLMEIKHGKEKNCKKENDEKKNSEKKDETGRNLRQPLLTLFHK